MKTIATIVGVSFLIYAALILLCVLQAYLRLSGGHR
jgi:presenilin-like A22 family membrane protease